METIHIINIMLGKVQSKPSVEGIYTSNDLEDVKGTLIGTNLKMTKKIGEEVTHRNPNSSFLVTRGSTTLPSSLESLGSSFGQYLTSTSSAKLYFLLNSANFLGVSTIDLNLPIMG